MPGPVDRNPPSVVDAATRWLDLPSAVTAARTARGEIAGFLRDCGVDVAVIDDAVVIVSELVTNAVRHAGPDGHSGLRMECTFDPPRIRLQVCDDGQQGTRSLHDQGAVGGRGLSIVAALADSWSIERAARGTVVTADISVARTLPGPR